MAEVMNRTTNIAVDKVDRRRYRHSCGPPDGGRKRNYIDRNRNGKRSRPNPSPSPPPERKSEYVRLRRPGFPEEGHDRKMGRSGGGYQTSFDSERGGGQADSFSSGSRRREGLMSYKQFIQELEDDFLPSEAAHRYQEYRSEYISKQKEAFFEAQKDKKWLKDRYHPTNIVAGIERRNDFARKQARDFQLDLQCGVLDIGPSHTASPSSRYGQPNDLGSGDEDVENGRQHGRGPSKETDLLSAAPEAHPLSSESRRIQVDLELAQALVRKLDLEKGIENNILCRRGNDRAGRDKLFHGASSCPTIIIFGLTSVKALVGIELLDTLLTYLWRIHGLDYYGMTETNKAEGLRHVRVDGTNSDALVNGAEWEEKLDTRWKERLKGPDPLVILAANEKIDAAVNEGLDPYVRKIRDEKYGWKYGCGAKGCTKHFRAAEFVHKHLKLKHIDLVTELTSKVREDLYFQNYMNDENAPGGKRIRQQPVLDERQQEHRLGPDNSVKKERARREREYRSTSAEGNLQSRDDKANKAMFDSRGVLMRMPGAGLLGPFVYAFPMLPGPQLSRNAPRIAFPFPPAFREDPKQLRSYQDLDVPNDEVTVIDYRSL